MWTYTQIRLLHAGPRENPVASLVLVGLERREVLESDVPPLEVYLAGDSLELKHRLVNLVPHPLVDVGELVPHGVHRVEVGVADASMRFPVMPLVGTHGLVLGLSGFPIG